MSILQIMAVNRFPSVSECQKVMKYLQPKQLGCNHCFLCFYLTVPLAEKIPWNPMNRASIQTAGRKKKWNGNGACVPRCGMKALTCCLHVFFFQLRRLWALLPTPSPSPLASRSRLARETLVLSASIEFWSMTVDITALTQVRQLAQSAEKLLIGWQNKQCVSSLDITGSHKWHERRCNSRVYAAKLPLEFIYGHWHRVFTWLCHMATVGGAYFTCVFEASLVKPVIFIHYLFVYYYYY